MISLKASLSLFFVGFFKYIKMALVIKNPPAKAGDKRLEFSPWVGKIPWRRTWQSLSSILACRIPWTEEPGGPQSMGSWRVGHD